MKAALRQNIHQSFLEMILPLAAALHSTMKGGGAGDYAAVNDSPRCYGRRRDRINAVHNI